MAAESSGTALSNGSVFNNAGFVLAINAHLADFLCFNRLVVEGECVNVYHTLENSRVYHETELDHIKFGLEVRRCCLSTPFPFIVRQANYASVLRAAYTGDILCD